ncbi:MAG: hypothetical protein J6B60_00270 [Clostridia bacterium]|nr:hypothetical protein [Clostridia bacterium]
MIKGCKKRMIFIKDTKSDYFDEAYFVLKGDTDYSHESENDMVKAAAMIIHELDNGKRFIRDKKRKSLKFLAGFILGSIIMGMVLALFIIFS